MRALFVYTAKVFSCNGKHYSNNLPQAIWKDRYRQLFDEVIVYARNVEVDHCNETNSDYEGVTFALTKLGINKAELILKNKQIYEEIEQLVLQCDFVVARMGFFGVLAAQCARRHGIPYTCEVVGSSWDDLWNYSISGKFAACWLQPRVKREVKKSKYAVYVTNEYLQKEYPYGGKQVGISNVVLQRHDEKIFEARMDKIVSYNEKTIYTIGTAAAIDVPYKGQRYVIEAIKKLRDKGIKCIYKLAGNGDRSGLVEYAKALQIEDQLEFTGAIPHEKMREYFSSLDIYAQPSLQEGLPRAMIEAMATGLPAIGFKTAGIPELIEKKYVCKQKSVDDLVDKIVALINDRNELYRVSKRNYEKSFEYEKDILEKRWFDFYSEAIRQ